MILIAVMWIVLSFAFWGLGKFLTGIFRAREHGDFTESGHLFLGLSFAGLLTSIWYCFFPVNMVWGGILVGLGLGSAFANLSALQKFRTESPWIIGFCFFLFGGLLISRSAHRVLRLRSLLCSNHPMGTSFFGCSRSGKRTCSVWECFGLAFFNCGFRLANSFPGRF